jgi:hypothetical protein
MSDTIECKKCKNPIGPRAKQVHCSGICQGVFHGKCSGVDLTNKKKKDGPIIFTCPFCPADNNVSVVMVQDGQDEEDITQETIENPISELESIEAIPPIDPNGCTVKALVESLNRVLADISALIKSQTYVCRKLDVLTAENKALLTANGELKERLDKTEKYVEGLEDRVGALETILDEPERRKIKNSVIVSGLPKNTQNIANIIVDIGNKIDMKLEPGDFEDISPLPMHAKTKSPAKFIVKFKSEVRKEEFLQKKRQRHIFTSDFNLIHEGVKEIFFQRQLSALQKKLYWEVKQIKDKFKYKFLWFKNNSVHLRATDTSEVINFKSFADLSKFQRNIIISSS